MKKESLFPVSRSDPYERNNFGYNTRSELISAIMSTNSFAYDYDQIGNRELARMNANTNTYSANELNQYTNIAYSLQPTAYQPTYDSDGNMLSNGDWHYSWNGENRLIMASNGNTVVQYAYDYMGRRFSKIINDGTTATTNYYIYDGWNLIQELTYSQTHTLTNYYTWGLDLSGTLQGAGGIGGLLSVTECSVGSTNQYFPVADGNGNITEYVTINGTVAAHYEYNPFGGTITSSGTKANDFRFRFSTKYLDDETGLYYYAMRYYSTELGRWISRDPIGKKGGLNVYGFVGNDGIINIDVLGLFENEIYMYDNLEGPSLGTAKTGHLSGRCGKLEIIVRIDADHRKGQEHNFSFSNRDPRIYAKKFVGIFVRFIWDGGHSGDCSKNKCCCDEVVWRQYVTTDRVWERDPVDTGNVNCYAKLMDSPGILIDKLGWFENAGGDSFVSYIDSFSCNGGARREIMIFWNYHASRKTHYGHWTVSYSLLAYMDPYD